MTRFLQIAFWAAMIVTLVAALSPQAPTLPGNPSDKLQHIAAFLTLSVLAGLAYPRLPLLWLFGILALFGALIEVGQMIPALNRHADLADFLADVAAAAVGLLVVAVLRRRARRS